MKVGQVDPDGRRAAARAAPAERRRPTARAPSHGADATKPRPRRAGSRRAGAARLADARQRGAGARRRPASRTRAGSAAAAGAPAKRGRRHQPRRPAPGRRSTSAAAARRSRRPRRRCPPRRPCAARARARRRHQPGAGHRARRPHLGRRREGARAAASSAARRRRRRVRARSPLPDFTQWGEVERQPMRAVRRKTAEHLSAAWATIPHVTQYDMADITGARGAAQEVREAGRGGRRQPDRHGDRGQGRRRGAARRSRSSTPRSTSRRDEIILKKYVNIGVAVDTDRGLLVPVIRDADQKNIVQLSVELRAARREGARPASCRSRRCRAAASASRTSAASAAPTSRRSSTRPKSRSSASRARGWSRSGTDGQFVPRLMLPLSLSYDHRVIDGADGIRFLRWVVRGARAAVPAGAAGMSAASYDVQ